MKIQNSFVYKITLQEDMNQFVESLNIQTDKVVIKPNWVDAEEGMYTEAKALDMFLTALKRPAVIVESYTFWRTDKILKGEGDYFSSKEGTLKTGIQHWDFYKKQDRWFLDSTGLGEILKKHQVTYINATNENWLKETVDSEIVQAEAERKFGPIFWTNLYSTIPKKIWELRDYTYISLAKAKLCIPYGPSLSIKNTYGLIPDPTRYEQYHGGEKEDKLTLSIIDANKIYQSIFPKRKFVAEGIFNSSLMDWNTNKLKALPGWGLIVGGDDALEVDSLTCRLVNQQPGGPLKNLFTEYEKSFGGKMIDSSLEIPQELKLDKFVSL